MLAQLCMHLNMVHVIPWFWVTDTHDRMLRAYLVQSVYELFQSSGRNVS